MASLTPRELSVHDTDSPEHVDFLDSFLGRDAIERRLRSVKRALQSSKGMFKQHWVYPNSVFWLGLQDALTLKLSGSSFANRVSATMRPSIALAAKLRPLVNNMPVSVQDGFRARILGDDILTPVIYEIDVASHFWQRGYNIEWFETDANSGKRIAEFAALSTDSELEVECKTKRADSHRKISRPGFYRLVDRVGSPLHDAGFIGSISITVPDKMPESHSWADECQSVITELSDAGQGQVSLADGTIIAIDTYRVGAISVPASQAIRDATASKKPHAHLAILASGDGTNPVNALIIEVASETHDQYLKGIFNELRDANRQFSGTRPSMISCFIPEVDAFDVLAMDSALKNMTEVFFSRHARGYLMAVTYSTDAGEHRVGNVITASSPALKFENPNYDIGFGPVTLIFDEATD